MSGLRNLSRANAQCAGWAILLAVYVGAFLWLGSAR